MAKVLQQRRSHGRAASGIIAAALALPGAFAALHAQETPWPLRAEGSHFFDASGRVVLLRGVNLAGDSKVPPFVAPAGPAELDRAAALGFNVIRLLVIWEALEPDPGRYRDDYLDSLRQVAIEANRRGIATLVDIHQDGFSRHVSRGCGDGFPSWAVSPRARTTCPDNGEDCRAWPLLMATDPATHRSFDDFFADRHGVRTRYLAMLDRVAAAFAGVPGVVGYDPMNEPWGSERKEISRLYEDAARVIRARHPSAVLFLEGHITTNTGLPSGLPRPAFGNVAYSPHYYHPLTILLGRWHGLELPILLGFASMNSKARAWRCPLFVGEFGTAAGTIRGGDYVTAIHDRLDASLASGAQWNLSPRWDPLKKDRWNGEDFSILTPDGQIRPNFRNRPYPRATAGFPTRLEYREARAGDPAEFEFAYAADPRLGETELHLPAAVFDPATTMLRFQPPDLGVVFEPSRQLVRLRAARPGPVAVLFQSTAPAR